RRAPARGGPGPAGETALRLAERAGEGLAAAGAKAIARGDMRATVNLLGRAASLLQRDDPRRLAVLPALGRAQHEAGRWDDAEASFTEALELAQGAGDRRAAAEAEVGLILRRLFTAATTSHDQVRDELSDPVAVFEQLGDEGGLARAIS